MAEEEKFKANKSETEKPPVLGNDCICLWGAVRNF